MKKETRDRNLLKKIEKIIATSVIEFWNGRQIKKSVTKYNKPFQVDNKIYRLTFVYENRCDHTTFFIPVEGELELIFRESEYSGRVYRGKDIGQILDLPYNEILKLAQPMFDNAKYNPKEIEQSRKDYEAFVISFRKNFLGEDGGVLID